MARFTSRRQLAGTRKVTTWPMPIITYHETTSIPGGRKALKKPCARNSSLILGSGFDSSCRRKMLSKKVSSPAGTGAALDVLGAAGMSVAVVVAAGGAESALHACPQVLVKTTASTEHTGYGRVSLLTSVASSENSVRSRRKARTRHAMSRPRKPSNICSRAGALTAWLACVLPPWPPCLPYPPPA